MAARLRGRPDGVFGLVVPGGRVVAITAALQGRTPAFRRRDRLRRQPFSASAILALLIASVLGAMTAPASAQSVEQQRKNFSYNARPPIEKPKQNPNAQKGQMLVRATEINYDYNNSRVSAVGNVQIYYNGSTLEADRVIYDQKTKRLHAEGNVRMTDASGKITYANVIDLSDDYRDGFIDSLRLDTPNQTRMAAARADRSNGDITIFQSGVYTACAPCRDNPKKPPLWQVKGARIIHDQTEKMLYFENASLEFFGQPIAYLPYFSTPDPTVQRKSGFLIPNVMSNSLTGIGFEVPYYFALAPDYDLTLTPRVTTRQGVLMQGEFRQRLINGAYEIRGYGISQLDPHAFDLNGVPSAGSHADRVGVDTHGQFALNNQWVWGWDAIYANDNTFFRDYGLAAYRNPLNSFLLIPDTGVSQLYLSGVGNRSFFDARTMYYQGYSAYDTQAQIPVVAPVIDYSNVLNRSILGGELSYKTNFTSLTRNQAAFEPINNAVQVDSSNQPVLNSQGDPVNACAQQLLTADPAKNLTRSNCLLRGIPGDYTRLSGQVDWRRSFTDPMGQIWTPFASVRGDLINADVSNQVGVDNFTHVGNTQVARVMPTIGLEYRYPFINVQPWGTTTIEPIAQVIIRPNEQYAGQLPNEDAQSLTFDDSNLFSVNKFSGWDRVEGGGRVNAGVQATTQFDRGGSINMLFGQSYQIFGMNSYAVQDLTNTGLDSGLDKPKSDYVARISYQPNKTFNFTTRARIDEATGSFNRLEVEGRANFDRWSLSLLYGDYAAQPELGYLNRRQGVLGTASVKLAQNWVVSGGLRYDITQDKVNQYIIGAGYVDDCFLLAVNYVTDYNYYTSSPGAFGTTVYSTTPVTDHRVMVQLGLRTIGTTGLSQSVGIQ
ncbi:MAG: LPS-assembly protein LptD [Bradyrhizobiaceae bacterium]|nr:MAG: LPS-assembly protein LptD [Bradyrhizobiaceae bacterium]